MGLTLRLTRQVPSPRRMAAWFGGIAALVGISSMFQPTIISGNSMSPTLRSGKMIWIDRAYYRTHKPQRGEVVVFRVLGQNYVKRIYRVGGESYFSLNTKGKSFTPIREGRENEVVRRFASRPNGLHVAKAKIPEDHVFVLGDNYFESVDSRDLGPIPVEAILGRAMLPADESFAMAHEFVPPPADKERAVAPSLQVVAHTR